MVTSLIKLGGDEFLERQLAGTSENSSSISVAGPVVDSFLLNIGICPLLEGLTGNASSLLGYPQGESVGGR